MNKSTLRNVRNHLERCKNNFTPPLQSYTNLTKYSQKIWLNSEKFEKFESGELIGLVAAYDNNLNKIGFITNVSVERQYQKCGISSLLLNECINYFNTKGYLAITLEVHQNNKKAISFYIKHNFKKLNINKNKITMIINLGSNRSNCVNSTKSYPPQ